MKILYAIQGTGNGHISRARDIIPHLQEFCQCDILVSGTQCDVSLGYPIKYRFKGLSFVFGKSGGVDLWKTITRANFFRLFREISQVPVEEYDLVINDFEPVSAWACKRKNVQCISLSHQGSLKSSRVPIPDQKDLLGKWILENYAPSTLNFGFHFKPYDEFIFTPVIRKQVRDSVVEDLNYYTVYLPAYDDQHLINHLSRFENTHWHIFSKHASKSYQTGNIRIKPIENNSFVEDMARSRGVLCGAGFETPAEALFLKKKLMVIPMHGQYEQQCNAEALKEMGIPVIKDLKTKYLAKIGEWLDCGPRIEVNYPDLTRVIVRKILEMKVQSVIRSNSWELSYQLTNRMAKI
jgi:uncharacterized protein (TIGR00661 family)